MNEKSLITKSAEETKQLAMELAQQIPLSSIITLTGDLGAGKTTFVQGLAAGFGIEKPVNSPTFLIIHRYELKTKNETRKDEHISARFLYHIDLYRIDKQDDIVGLGLLDILKEKESIVVIEWAEKMGKFLPEERIDVQFGYRDENKRKITINFQNPSFKFQ